MKYLLWYAFSIAALAALLPAVAKVDCELDRECHEPAPFEKESSNNTRRTAHRKKQNSTIARGNDTHHHDHQQHQHHSRVSARQSEIIIGLQQRVFAIQMYLHNPSLYLEQMDFENYIQDMDAAAKFSIPPNQLVSILEDLEIQLDDSEKARQFYNLGGWSLLTSLVSSTVHTNNKQNNKSSNKDDDKDKEEEDSTSKEDELNDKVLFVRANAAMAMTTIIKDKPEHRPWVLDQILLEDDEAMTTIITTPLHLVVQALVQVSSDTASASENQEQLAKETMHALEAFLHDNRPAQVAFTTMSEVTTMENDHDNHPAKILGHQVSLWAEEAAKTCQDATSSNTRMPRHAIDLTTRLLKLANEIVDKEDDIHQHSPPEEDHMKKEQDATIEVLLTHDWCHAVLQAATLSFSSDFKRLVFKNLQKTALHAVATHMGPHCLPYYQQDAEGQRLVEKLQTMAITNARSNSNNNLRANNKGYDKERIQLVEQAVAVITTTTTTTSTSTSVTSVASALDK